MNEMNGGAPAVSDQEQPGRWGRPDWEKRKMEDAYDRYASLLSEKIASFRKDGAFFWLNHERVSWPKPLYKGSYNGMNALMLMLHCEKEGFTVPVFATRDRIMSLNYQTGDDGRSVNAVGDDGNRLPFVHLLKGAKAFPVFMSQAVVTSKATGDTLPYPEYVRLGSERQKDYRITYNPSIQLVYNVDQTNISEARPQLYQRLCDENRPRLLEEDNEKFRFPAADAIISDDMWLCEFRKQWEGEIFYDMRARQIVIPLKDAFEGGNDYYSALFKKMAVSAIDSGQFASLPVDDGHNGSEYVRRELVSEIGSALVCQRYGIRKPVAREDLAFRDRWIRNLQDNPLYVRSVLKDVKESCCRMTVMIDCTQKVYIDKNKGEDLHEDGQSAGMDVNGDGVVDDGDVHYSPDRKQGSGESPDEPAEESHRKTGVRR